MELDVFSSPSAQITHTNRPTELASHHSRASRRPREDGGAGPKSFDTPRATNPRSPTARTQPRRMRRKSDNLNARENRFLLGFPTGCCLWRFSAFLDFEEGNLLGNFHRFIHLICYLTWKLSSTIFPEKSRENFFRKNFKHLTTGKTRNNFETPQYRRQSSWKTTSNTIGAYQQTNSAKARFPLESLSRVENSAARRLKNEATPCRKRRQERKTLIFIILSPLSRLLLFPTSGLFSRFCCSQRYFPLLLLQKGKPTTVGGGDDGNWTDEPRGVCVRWGGKRGKGFVYARHRMRVREKFWTEWTTCAIIGGG